MKRYWRLVAIGLILVGLVSAFGKGIADPLKCLAFCLIVLGVLLSLVYLFFANELIEYFTPVHDFRELKQGYAALLLDPTRLPKSLLVEDLVERRVEEVSHADAEPEFVKAHKNLRLGNLISIAARKSPMRHLTRELQAYAFLLFSFFVLSLLAHSHQVRDAKSFMELVNVMVSEEFIPLVELFAIVYIVIRIVSEWAWLRSLMEGE